MKQIGVFLKVLFHQWTKYYERQEWWIIWDVCWVKIAEWWWEMGDGKGWVMMRDEWWWELSDDESWVMMRVEWGWEMGDGEWWVVARDKWWWEMSDGERWVMVRDG